GRRGCGRRSRRRVRRCRDPHDGHLRVAACVSGTGNRPIPMPDDTASVRLDLWLWAARYFKTRALAKQAIETGRVEIGGQRAKPARGVRVGDVLQVARMEERFEVEVLALSNVRGPASVAQTLYRESETSRLVREQAR